MSEENKKEKTRVKAEKLQKLRLRYQKEVERRDKLNEGLKKLQAQIDEEESRAFRDTIESMKMSFDEAVEVLKVFSETQTNEEVESEELEKETEENEDELI